MRKKLLIIILLIVSTIVLVFLFVQSKHDAKEVSNLPAGFVALDDVPALSNNTLRYVFWESQLSFVNAEGQCIYQSSVKDSSFIVKYQGEYYISTSKLFSAKDNGTVTENPLQE